jgi:hypothetical protein
MEQPGSAAGLIPSFDDKRPSHRDACPMPSGAMGRIVPRRAPTRRADRPHEMDLCHRDSVYGGSFTDPGDRPPDGIPPPRSWVMSMAIPVAGVASRITAAPWVTSV